MRYPFFLLLAVFPLFYLFKELGAAKKKGEAFYSFSAFYSKEEVSKSFIQRHIYRTILNFTGMVMLIISLSMPFTEEVSIIDRQDYFTSDNMLVFDISRSMLADDRGKSRLEKSRETAAGIVSAVEGRFGIAVFKGEAFTLLPLTENIDAVHDMIEIIDPDIFTSRGTNLGKGLLQGIESFPDMEKTVKRMFVFTDGEEPEPERDSGIYSNIKDNLYSKGISVIIIKPDNAEGTIVPGAADISGSSVISVPDIEKLNMIGKITGSSVINFSSFSPETIASLNIYKQIIINLNHVFAAAGLLFLTAAIAVKGIKWKKSL